MQEVASFLISSGSRWLATHATHGSLRIHNGRKVRVPAARATTLRRCRRTIRGANRNGSGAGFVTICGRSGATAPNTGTTDRPRLSSEMHTNSTPSGRAQSAGWKSIFLRCRLRGRCRADASRTDG